MQGMGMPAYRRHLREWNAIGSFLRFELTAEDKKLIYARAGNGSRTSFAPLGPRRQAGPFTFA